MRNIFSSLMMPLIDRQKLGFWFWFLITAVKGLIRTDMHVKQQ